MVHIAQGQSETANAGSAMVEYNPSESGLWLNDGCIVEQSKRVGTPLCSKPEQTRQGSVSCGAFCHLFRILRRDYLQTSPGHHV